jgi:hydrogenase maturation factor
MYGKISKEVLEKMKKNKYGLDSIVIGKVAQKREAGMVYIKTKEGSNRIIKKLIGDILPRIC